MIRECDKRKIIKSVIGSMNMVNYPLSFNDDYYFYNNNKNFNCYAYAMGFKKIDNSKLLLDKGLSIYNPGTVSGFKIMLYDEDRLIKAFLDDCRVLGLECIPTDLYSPLEDDMSKIALYIAPEDDIVRDFHFARQNKDGMWSNMKSVGGPVISLGNEDIEYMPGYNFLGSYSLRKKR